MPALFAPYRTFQTCAPSFLISPSARVTVQTASTTSSREFSGFLPTVRVPARVAPAVGGKERVSTSGERGRGERRGKDEGEKEENAPTSTSIGSLSKNIVCFQCVGVSHAPVVKKTSPSLSLTLSFRFDESHRRGSEVK